MKVFGTQNSFVTVDHVEYHVTRSGPQGVYGHAVRYCDESGCSRDAAEERGES